jgi:hypothetical protein
MAAIKSELPGDTLILGIGECKLAKGAVSRLGADAA